MKLLCLWNQENADVGSEESPAGGVENDAVTEEGSAQVYRCETPRHEGWNPAAWLLRKPALSADCLDLGVFSGRLVEKHV